MKGRIETLAGFSPSGTKLRRWLSMAYRNCDVALSHRCVQRGYRRVRTVRADEAMESKMLLLLSGLSSLFSIGPLSQPADRRRGHDVYFECFFTCGHMVMSSGGTMSKTIMSRSSPTRWESQKTRKRDDKNGRQRLRIPNLHRPALCE